MAKQKQFFSFTFPEFGEETVRVVEPGIRKAPGPTDHKKEIVNMLMGISGAHSPYEVFCDWLECLAIAISNSVTLHRNQVWHDREEQYMRVMARYNAEERRSIADMTALLSLAMEEKIGDILGEIFMECKFGSSAGGQFFTPFHVSELLSEVSVNDLPEGADGKISMNEPTCGSGGTIIAAAKSLMQKGINFQKKLDVVAQDIDWRCVYMCYVQLSLYGIKAIVVQGDTLLHPYLGPGSTDRRNIFITPAKAGALIG